MGKSNFGVVLSKNTYFKSKKPKLFSQIEKIITFAEKTDKPMEKSDKDMENFYRGYLISLGENESGIFLCTCGSAEIFINDKAYIISKGSLYIVSPLITLCYVHKSPDFAGIHILDDMSRFYSVIHQNVNTLYEFQFVNNPCLQLESKDMELVISRYEEIEQKRKECSLTSERQEKELLMQMIHLLLQETMLEVLRIVFRNGTIEPQTVNRQKTIFYNFIYNLHLNFQKERSVSFYASQSNLSPAYFTSVVKKESGKRPSEWISTIVILQSKLLLEKTKKSIKEIALEMNFPEQFTFRKYFKQQTGLSPKHYREQFAVANQKEE